MSRHGFRGRVEAPRPVSAWILVTVASGTLWITQQLDAWAIAVQVLAIVVSLARRVRPHPWQSSPVALNVGMFGIVAATIAVALRGPPSTIALAHFAALTQGLQLLDARPRRTEFLLVTLALFQVVLASNLTDSVFFIPLLIAFVLATVWTLLVHTLHSEAIEAGIPQAVGRALTPGLLRTTLIASGLSVALAMVLFLVLPRLRSSMVRGSPLAAPLATAGFSETVTLGELGRIRQDPTVMLRVETLEGARPDFGAAYWRGLAFDRFDGRSWSITPATRTLVPGSAAGDIRLGPSHEPVSLVQRIVREPIEGGVVFGVGEVRRIQGTVRRLERDSSGGLYAASQVRQRVHYTLSTHPRVHREGALQRDRARPPLRNGARYLSLPPLSDALAVLAREITRGAETDAERVRALEEHLLRTGRYSDTPPRHDPSDTRTPVEVFLLGERAGHCEYFASAMVVLARSLGIPARLINGFAGGRENRIGGFVELTRSDAHAWVEVHYERAGWVRYDPTPPDLRARPAAAPSLASRLRELGSALELWWFQRVVGFDRADQIRALRSAWLAWQGSRRSSRPAESRWRASSWRWRPSESIPWSKAVLLAAVCGATVVGAWWLRRARRDERIPPCYAEALRLLARRGLVRGPPVPARDFARTVCAELPAPAGAAFTALTESYLLERFGGRPAPAGAAELRALRESLHRGA